MKQQISFDEWMKKVELSLPCHPDDLPDFCYRDAYDNGKSPQATAKKALKYAMES